MLDFFLYLIYKLFKFIVLILPKKAVKVFLDCIVFLVFKLNKKHYKVAKANLDFVYDNSISEVRKQEIIKNSYKNLVYNMYEFIENQTLSLEEFEKKISIKNEQYILNAIENGRKIILITAHYGNWELGGSFIPLKYGPTTVVGRLLNNKLLNDELIKSRSQMNGEMLPTNEAGKGLIKALKNNRILGLVIDQHNREGIDVQFLGHNVKLIDSTSRLATKFNAIILPVFFVMDDFRKYTVIFHNPIEPKEFEGENQIQRLTEKQAEIMEKQIKEIPDQWFWQHKRFKYYHKEIYE